MPSLTKLNVMGMAITWMNHPPFKEEWEPRRKGSDSKMDYLICSSRHITYDSLDDAKCDGRGPYMNGPCTM